MPTTGFVKLYMDTLWVHCLFFEIILRAFHKARYGGRLDLGACDRPQSVTLKTLKAMSSSLHLKQDIIVYYSLHLKQDIIYNPFTSH